MMQSFSGYNQPPAGGKTEITEQRQHGRTPSRLRAAFQPDGSETRQTIISNISLGGAWLDLREKQPKVGCEGKIHTLVGDLHLYLIAKVVRTTPEGIGVTFIDMGIETYENLKQYVEKASSQQRAS